MLVTVKVYAWGKQAKDVTLALFPGKNATLSSNDSHVCKLADDATCHLLRVGKNPRVVNVTVTIAKSVTNGTVPFKALASDKADGFADVSSPIITIKVTPAPTPSPTPSASKTTSSTSNTTSNANGSVTNNPQGTSSTVQSPNVAAPLPTITPGAAPPSVAPDGSTAEAAGSTTALRSGSSQQDLTFERLASTQVAWLAALLVAFSVLLTQVRLGRRPNAAVAARPKAAHRRTRKGVFEA